MGAGADDVRAALIEAEAFEVKHRIVGGCPRCHGAGIQLLDGYDQQQMLVPSVECSCSRRFRRHLELMIAGVPEALIHDIMTEHLDERQVVEIDIGNQTKLEPTALLETHLRPYVQQHKRVLARGYSYLFVGTNSVGKTFCSLKVLHSYLGLGYSGHYIKFRALMKLINRAIVEKGQLRTDAEDLLAEIKAVDLLVVDELGKETGSREHIAGEVEELLKDRDQGRRPTIVVSNYDYQELEQLYTSNIVGAFMRNYRVLIFDPRTDKRKAARETWYT